MVRECYVTLTVSSLNGNSMPPRELGEFQSTWKPGVSIGSDAGCDVVLSELAPVAAVVLAASNHKLLYRHGSPGFDQARNYSGGPVPPYEERVDYREFNVGGYVLRFGEAYRDESEHGQRYESKRWWTKVVRFFLGGRQSSD